MFERVIVASGTSNRQTKALASSVRETVKERGLPVLSVEGADNGEWIIVDCGAAVAHIMQPAIRDYYRLEEIWGEKPVKMKIDGGPGPAAAPAPNRNTSTPKKAAPAKAAALAEKAVAKKSAGPTRAAGAKKPARKRAAPSR